ncbi:MAG: S41 family peptidase [Planctomycetota bacterium]|nr:S41 family peptidase [Planctomycetota bacterium]
MTGTHLKTLLTAVLMLGAVCGSAEAADPYTRGLRYPSLTPDGKKVVFGYRGDIWIAPVDGKGTVTRLTIHNAQDTLARVSPDGKQIAFSSLRNGRYDLFIIPITGGKPKRVTFHSGSEALCDWSPDGKKLLFSSERGGGVGRFDLYEVAIDGGTPKRITFDGARDGAYTPDGKNVVYARGFNSIYWDNYEGSANYDLYITGTKGGLPTRLTKTDGNERYPFVSKDSKTLFFVAEEKGVANFYSMPLTGGKRKQVTKYTGNDVHRPDLNWNCESVVFERAGQLFTTNLTKPGKEPTAIKLHVRSDARNSGFEARTVTGGGEQVHLSQDGRMIAFTLHGDIWIMPAAGGKGRRITSGPSNDQWPRFSPDGTKIAYFSNKSGNNDIYLLDIKTGASTPVTTNRAADHFHNWSPDGKSLVFCSERSGNRDIWTIDLKSKATKQLTKHSAGDDDPSFSPDGQFIAFDSARGGTQAIYIMNVDGSAVRRVTPGSGFFQVPSFSPDSRMIVYEAYSPTNGQSGGLFVISVGGGPSMQIARDGKTACWSGTGDYIYFTEDRKAAGNGVFRVKAPESVVAGEHIPFIGTVTVNLRKELSDLFDEAWNALGSGFYDRKMHGVNWNDMKRKYRDMAIDAEDKTEFHNIIRQMLAELGASHLGIWGGSQSGNSALPKVKQTGYLGLDFDCTANKDGSMRIEDVLAGGPADKAGLRIGDVVTRIGRTRLSKNINLDKVLAGTVGKDVLIRFKPFSKSGLGDERAITLKPMPFSSLRGLEYRNWHMSCDKRVRDACSFRNEYVYIHLTAMNQQNLNKFQQAVARWNRIRSVKGMILDVRNNGGGNIHNQLMAVLIAKPLAHIRGRNGQRLTQPVLYWDRPVVVLTNERSFSDAEVFPYMFRAAGVGKIVGVPTAGGVIGTNNITLSDGSSFRIARSGFFGMDGTNLEGYGVKPDFIVEETSEDRREGRDPQLLKALEVLKAEAAAAKAAKPKAKSKPTKKPNIKASSSDSKNPKAKKGHKDPIFNVQEGEWIRLRQNGRNGVSRELTLRVVSVDAETVSMERSFEVNGKEQVSPFSLPRRELLKPPAALKVAAYKTETLTIGGKDLKCILMELTGPRGEKIKWYVSHDVPVHGLVRIETNGVVNLELVEWGGFSKPKVKATKKPLVEAKPTTKAKTAAKTKPAAKAKPKHSPKPRRKSYFYDGLDD